MANRRVPLRYAALLLVLAVLSGHGDLHADPVRAQEIVECRPGEIALWADGVDRRAIHSSLHIVYRHRGAPGWFREEAVAARVQRAATEWSKCGIPVAIVPDGEIDADHPGTIVIQWDEMASRGNFGLAHLSQRTLSLGPGAFRLLRTKNPAHDAMETLQLVISHEMGHFLGLMAHSRRCVDVLSYYHDGKGGQCYTRNPAGIGTVPEYRHNLPTACDIQRCRALNAGP